MPRTEVRIHFRGTDSCFYDPCPMPKDIPDQVEDFMGNESAKVVIFGALDAGRISFFPCGWLIFEDADPPEKTNSEKAGLTFAVPLNAYQQE